MRIKNKRRNDVEVLRYIESILISDFKCPRENESGENISCAYAIDVKNTIAYDRDVRHLDIRFDLATIKKYIKMIYCV